MRSISFENLRRLVSRKKDRDEPSFKRSESFKRISIRKSYLDRGKRRNKLQKVNNETSKNDNIVVVEQNDSKEIIKEIAISKCNQNTVKTNVKKTEGTIGYNEWLNDINGHQEKWKEETEIPVQRISKPKIPKPPRKSKPSKNPDSITKELGILRLESSPIFMRCSKINSVESTCVENISESIEDDQLTPDLSLSMTTGEGPPSISVSLGRVWLDSVPVPFPSHGLSSSTSAVHHSLDSALKERKQSGQHQVARTVSAPEKSRVVVSKDCSSVDEIPLSILKDSESKCKKNGFFRKKLSKPSLSITKEGYFKRTSTSKTSSIHRKKDDTIIVSSSVNQKNYIPMSNNLMNFVTPEKRSCQKTRRVWQEIRYFTVEESPSTLEKKKSDDWSSNVSDEFDDHQLLLSGDFNEKQELSTSIHSSSSSMMTSSFLSSSSSKSSRGYECSSKPKISDFNEDKIFSKELRGVLAQRPIWKSSKYIVASSNFFASKQFLSYLAKKSELDVEIDPHESVKYNGSYYRCLSSSESETEQKKQLINKRNIQVNEKFHVCKNGQETKRNNHTIKLERSKIPKRRPLRRKSQLKRANGTGQPVYLIRKCSSLRKRSSKI